METSTIHLLLLEGDGIGPEIMESTVTVLQSSARRVGVELRLERAEIGLISLQKSGTTFPQPVLDSARKADGVVLGPVSHISYPPRAEGGVNPSAELRTKPEDHALQLGTYRQGGILLGGCTTAPSNGRAQS
jgi:3-isopropylmalate dehydrogenase